MQGIKITTDNVVSVVEVDTSDYHSIIECIGCDIFEVVSTQLLYEYFDDKVVMLIDEEGLLNDLPKNDFGCFVYGTLYHGNPICGDLLLLVREDSDLIGFEDVVLKAVSLVTDFSFLRLEGDSNG